MSSADTGSDPVHKRAARVCKDAAHRGKERSKKELVDVITSKLVIQAIMTGAAFGVVGKLAEAVGVYLKDYAEIVLPFTFPLPSYVSVVMVFVFFGAFKVNQHTDVFRDWVEETTGEEANEDDDAAAESGG